MGIGQDIYFWVIFFCDCLTGMGWTESIAFRIFLPICILRDNKILLMITVALREQAVLS